MVWRRPHGGPSLSYPTRCQNVRTERTGAAPWRLPRRQVAAAARAGWTRRFARERWRQGSWQCSRRFTNLGRWRETVRQRAPGGHRPAVTPATPATLASAGCCCAAAAAAAAQHRTSGRLNRSCAGRGRLGSATTRYPAPTARRDRPDRCATAAAAASAAAAAAATSGTTVPAHLADSSAAQLSPGTAREARCPPRKATWATTRVNRPSAGPRPTQQRCCPTMQTARRLATAGTAAPCG